MEQRRIKFIKMGLCMECGEKTKHKRCDVCHLKMISSNIFGTTKRFKELGKLFALQNGRCKYSGRTLILQENCELDHIMPRAKNGTNTISNLQWLHRDVNKMKHDMTEDEFFSSIQDISNHILLEFRSHS